MQFDIFGYSVPIEVAPAAAKDERSQIIAQHAAEIGALPEKLRMQCTPAAPVPAAKPQLDEWTRTTQRTFLLWMIGALARGIYTASSMTSLPGVLQRLNGLAGEW